MLPQKYKNRRRPGPAKPDKWTNATSVLIKATSVRGLCSSALMIEKWDDDIIIFSKRVSKLIGCFEMFPLGEPIKNKTSAVPCGTTGQTQHSNMKERRRFDCLTKMVITKNGVVMWMGPKTNNLRENDQT